MSRCERLNLRLNLRCFVWAVSCCVICTAGASAQVATSGAQEPTAGANVEESSLPYREAIKEALEEQNRGNFKEALALFLVAHRLQPSARTLRGLGVMEFEEKNYPQCIRRLEASLASKDRALTTEMRAEVQGILDRARNFVGHFVIRTAPELEGVQALVDRNAVSLHDGGELLLSLGKHLIQVQVEGYREQSKSVHVRGGERETLTFTLQPMQSAPIAALRVEPAKAATPLLQSPWLWTGLGAVVVGGVITAVALASGGDGISPEPGDVGGVLVTLGGGR